MVGWIRWADVCGVEVGGALCVGAADMVGQCGSAGVGMMQTVGGLFVPGLLVACLCLVCGRSGVPHLWGLNQALVS